MPAPPNVFAASGLDRHGDRRRDARWLAERLADPRARAVPMWGERSLVQKGDPPRAALVPLAELAPLVDDCSPILLGVEAECALFAYDLSHLEETTAAERLRQHGAFTDLRQVGSLLEPRDGGLLAFARGMTHWHRETRFCGRCGAAHTVTQAGHVLVCSNQGCARETFPRTDPAIIVLAHDGARALLGRQAAWPTGVYSTLAGFCEPGESLEDAVVREVREETGILVAGARYHSSQPWPFPQSLMLGFLAEARGGEPRVDGEELEDARWFERAELRAALAQRELRLPPPLSIARRLIDDWLAG